MGDVTLARLLSERGISDQRVLEAIASLQRADFLPPERQWEAGQDAPLPIGHGQTISQPYIVAYMSQALALRPGERVLEIGTGSGYQAAVLAKLGAEVYSMEIVEPLAKEVSARLRALGLEHIHLRHGDGNEGWPDAAPFDAIILTAAPTSLPETLLWQLAPGGRLIAPVGSQEEVQRLVLVRKGQDGTSHVERLLDVRFVPMTSAAAAGVTSGS